MTVSRWKIMAGMFGVSVGGLAAVALAGPGFKKGTDAKCTPMETPTAVVLTEPPLVVPVSAAVPVAPPAELVVPAAPSLTLPDPQATPIVPIGLQVQAPTGPMEVPTVPPMPFPGTVQSETAPTPKLVDLPAPLVIPVAGSALPVDAPPAAAPEVLVPVNPPSAPVVSNEGVQTPVVSSKYRITLRVGGGGEPVFEVRGGDELLLKVACEKVDVKAPTEKGQTLSAVKAMGKVRFIGFGSEGTCDELSFLAGTGEVSLGGNVKVQVKDKFGRVETELTGDKMNYRLDAAHSMSGGLEP